MPTVPSIPNTDRIADFTASAAQDEFAITWVVIADSELLAVNDLVVMVDDVEIDAADFSFSGTSITGLSGIWNGGTVTLDDPLAGGERVIIYSKRDPRRTGYFLEGKTIPFTTLDQLLNDFAVQLRDLSLQCGRALKISIDDYLDGDTDIEVLAQIEALIADATAAVSDAEAAATAAAASAVAAAASAALISGAVVYQPAHMTALRAITTSGLTNAVAILQGYAAANDGGQGIFIWNSASTATDDDGVYIIPVTNPASGRWQRVVESHYNVKWWGAKGDNATNDKAAIQKAVDFVKALGSGTVYFPKGTYRVGSSVAVTEVKGHNWLGDGSDNTKITATGDFAAVQVTGMWRSVWQGIMFTCISAVTVGAVFELDGRSDGTFGVQGNKFINCYFHGNYASKYAIAIVRVAGGSGQGSENEFLGCNFDGAYEACFVCNGNNALNNTIFGGNFQGYQKHGLQILAGNVNVYSVGFQSVYGYTQITNGGFDIDNSNGNLGDTQIVQGCRTESLPIFQGGGSYCHMIGVAQQQSGAGSRANSTVYALNAIVKGTTAAGNTKMYRCTTAGTSGGSAPTWPESGTVADNTVVWTQTDFNLITGGTVTVSRGQLQLGRVANCVFNEVLFSRNDPQNHPNIVGIFNECYRDGNPSSGSRVKIFGTSKTGSVTLAELPAAPLPGETQYVSDATPGTNPATGAGSGALCVADGAASWRALS